MKNTTKHITKKEKIELLISLLGTIISLTAIFIALYTSSQQSKIALFQQKFETYQTYKALIENSQSAKNTLEETLWDVLENNKSLDESSYAQECMNLYSAFIGFIIPNIDTTTATYPADTFLIIVDQVNEYCIQLDGAKYLFDLTKIEKQQIDKTVAELKNLISSSDVFFSGEKVLKAHIDSFFSQVEQINFLEKMQNQLDL